MNFPTESLSSYAILSQPPAHDTNSHDLFAKSSVHTNKSMFTLFLLPINSLHRHVALSGIFLVPVDHG